MKYCSNCGSDQLKFIIPEDDNRKRFCCPDCGEIFYSNPNVVVGALSVHDNKILMAKRNIFPRKDKWTLPAGFLENGETLQEGAIRETQEETLADIKIIQPYTMISLPHINQVHMFYLADLPNATFGTTMESSEVKLLALEEIPWEEVAFPTVKLTLKFYQDDLSKNTFTFREDQILLS